MEFAMKKQRIQSAHMMVETVVKVLLYSLAMRYAMMKQILLNVVMMVQTVAWFQKTQNIAMIVYALHQVFLHPLDSLYIVINLASREIGTSRRNKDNLLR